MRSRLVALATRCDKGPYLLNSDLFFASVKPMPDYRRQAILNHVANQRADDQEARKHEVAGNSQSAYGLFLEQPNYWDAGKAKLSI